MIVFGGFTLVGDNTEMIPLVENNRDALARLCDAYGVAHLAVFGSSVTADCDGDARDVDLLVRFRPRNDMGPADQYFGLLAALEDLLGRPVDLVCESAMRNPFFINQVNQTRTTLYAA